MFCDFISGLLTVKAFSHYKVSVSKLLRLVIEKIENICGKGNDTGNTFFLKKSLYVYRVLKTLIFILYQFF